MNRIYNFSAGPAVLPEAVLESIATDMLSYKGRGLSVMEMSHRSSSYMAIHQRAKDSLRQLMAIPDNYEILFLQGGASLQFASVPLNLLTDLKKADYILSGSFAKKAYQEAKKFGDIQVVASTENEGFTHIPELENVRFRDDASYVHLCINNTIYGTRFKPSDIPDTGDIPLVADMSSNILSEVYDVSDFGLIYAGAQKNIGPAGLTVVIIRQDLLDRSADSLPSMVNYAIQAANDSMYNTPPTFAIYTAGLVFDWLLDQGGVQAIEVINKRKAAKLYDYIDINDFYRGTARTESRSLMNVTFTTPTAELDKAFVAEATALGLENLKGHRSVGGMRASIYNAMPESGIDALIDFMANFQRKHQNQ